MRIFGIEITKTHIRIPFTEIRIPTGLLIMTILNLTSARANTFPAQGTFRQQQNWVGELPRTCSVDTSNMLTSLANAADPFSHIATMPTNSHAEVIQHLYDSEYGVLTRRSAATNTASTEEVMIGGEGGEQPVTFFFKRTPDGNLKTIKREKYQLQRMLKVLRQLRIIKG